MLIVLIGISFLTFLLTYLSPGDPVRNMYLAQGLMPDEEQVAIQREEMGLNDPFFTQYFRWLGNCLKGDFGTSFSLNKPVVSLLSARLWPTLKLALMSMVLMLIVAVPLGVLSAVNQNKPIDYIVRAITFFGVSVPNFWVGLMLILIFCVQLRLLPVVSSGGSFKDLILPAGDPGHRHVRQVHPAGPHRRAGGAPLRLRGRRPGPGRAGEKDPLGQRVPQLPAAPDHHAGPVHRLPAGRHQRRGGHLLLSRPGQPGRVRPSLPTTTI